MKKLSFAVVMLLGLAATAQEAQSEPQTTADQPAAASAEVHQEAAPAPKGPLPSLELSLRAGGHFPQLVNKLGTSFDGILHAGYMVMDSKQLQLFVELGYTAPSHEVTGTDPRLQASGSTYKSTVVVKDLDLGLGLSYLFTPPNSDFVPYLGAAFVPHFIRSEVTAAGGADFGNHDETATQFGGAAFVGAGFHVGPGLLLGELRFGYAPIDERVTGVTNIGALSVMLGYGLLI